MPHVLSRQLEKQSGELCRSIQAEWDQDTPPFYMSRALFPLLVNAPEKRYVMIGEGTHHVMLEKNRMELFREVQAFLDEGAPADEKAVQTSAQR